MESTEALKYRKGSISCFVGIRMNHCQNQIQIPILYHKLLRRNQMHTLYPTSLQIVQ